MKCEKKVVTLHPLMRKRDNIFRSEVVRNTTKLLSANVLAQVVGLLIYPLLTRLYSQDDFGLLSLFVSMGGVLAIIATAEYQYSIVLPGDDKTAVGSWHAGAIILCCVTLLISLILNGSMNADLAVADVDQDGGVSVGDVTRLIEKILYGY